MFLNLAIILILFLPSCSSNINNHRLNKSAENKTQIHNGGYPSIVGFYHVYTENTRLSGIIEEQVRLLNESGVLNSLDKLYYFVIGKNAENFFIEKKNLKFEKLGYKKIGHEILTLKYLYDYCKQEPRSNVLYFHPKGSYHDKPSNTYLRKLLGFFTFHLDCFDAMLNHDTCGARFTVLPAAHYCGNFWWARCKYVKTLIDPMSMEENSTLRKLTHQLYKGYNQNKWISGMGRFFAGIGSGINLNPADCIPTVLDHKWFFGGNEAPRLNLSTMNQTATVICKKASMISEPGLFSNEFKLNFRKIYSWEKISKRSLIWYGDFSSSFIRWRQNLGEKAYYF